MCCLLLPRCHAAVTETTATSVLRKLIASYNNLIGDIQAIQVPRSVVELHIAGTGISGSFDSGWTSRQGSQFGCLIAYQSPGLCGLVPSSIPCTAMYPDGTSLCKCSTAA